MKTRDRSSILKRLKLPVCITFIGIAVLISLAVIKSQTSEGASIPGDCDQLGCTQRFVVAPNGVRLAVKEFGSPDGPAIMLIHGFSHNHLAWTHQFEDLVKEGFRVVAWDYPGHGDSDKPTDLRFYAEPQVWADYVQAVIDDLNLGVGEQACLVGHSLGGLVIDDYISLANDTSDVAGVVYVGSVHRFDIGFTQGSAEFFAFAALFLDQELSVRLRATRDFTRLLTLESLSRQEEIELNMSSILVIREAIQGLFAYISAGTTPSNDEILLDRLSSLPVLLIHGKEDATVQFAVAEASLALIEAAGGKDVELISLRGVGHSPPFEAQKKFNKKVGMFCDQALKK